MSYSFSLTGQLHPGCDVDGAAAALAKLFKIQPAKADSLLRSGKPRSLIKGLAKDRAEKLADRLSDLGIGYEVEPSLELQIEETPALALETVTGFDEPDIHNDDTVILARPAAKMATAAAPAAASTVSAEATSDEEYGGHDPYIESVPIMNGLRWLSTGFEIMKTYFFAWVFAVAVASLLNGALAAIPTVGLLLSWIIWPVLFAGLMVGAHRQADGEEFGAFSFLAGFSRRPFSLVMVGVATTLFGAATGAIIVGAIYLLADSFEITTIFIIAAVLFMPLMVIMFFAPSMVALHKVPVLHALKWSVVGGVKNLLPLSLYLFGTIVVMFLGALLAGIGLLVALPIVMASMYAAYMDIFDWQQ